jgi:hypothetical protein
MQRHVLWCGLEQLRDLCLGQPDSLVLQPALDTRAPVFCLVEKNLAASLGGHQGAHASPPVKAFSTGAEATGGEGNTGDTVSEMFDTVDGCVGDDFPDGVWEIKEPGKTLISPDGVWQISGTGDSSDSVARICLAIL